MDDLRYAVRQLFRAPTFAIVTILTLALGVGANTAIFSVIQAVLMHPSGVQDPERVASFHAKYTQLNLPMIGVSAPDFADVRSMQSQVDAAAMVQAVSYNATFDGRTQHLRAAKVSQQWFQVFGAEPILGRTFLSEEDQKGAERVVVLSYAAWQRMFGGQQDVMDKKVLLDDQSYRVIGVMRSDFAWPKGVELWTSLGLAPTEFAAQNRFNESYNSVVRMKPGVTVAQLNAGLEQKRLEEIRREGTSGFKFGQSFGLGDVRAAVDGGCGGGSEEAFGCVVRRGGDDSTDCLHEYFRADAGAGFGEDEGAGDTECAGGFAAAVGDAVCGGDGAARGDGYADWCVGGSAAWEDCCCW